MNSVTQRAGYLFVLMAVMTVGCAFHPPVVRGRAESEVLPQSSTLRLKEVVIPDMLNVEQLEHEIRTAFMIAAARAEARGGVEAAARTQSTAGRPLESATPAPEVTIRLDRRSYTRGMRRSQILTLTLQLSYPTRAAVAVLNRRIDEDSPTFVVLHDMTGEALRRALKELE